MRKKKGEAKKTGVRLGRESNYPQLLQRVASPLDFNTQPFFHSPDDVVALQASFMQILLLFEDSIQIKSNEINPCKHNKNKSIICQY